MTTQPKHTSRIPLPFFILCLCACGAADDDSGASPYMGDVADPQPMNHDPTQPVATEPGPVGDPNSAQPTVQQEPPTLPQRGPSITFDWPEVPPGAAAGACDPGRYEGGYDGMYGGGIPTTGPINVVLGASQNGEFLEINEGVFDASWNGLIESSAPINGQLDCATGEFHAFVRQGVFMAAGFPGGTFDVDFNGLLDDATNTISGTYAFTSTGGFGDGVFSVTLTP